MMAITMQGMRQPIAAPNLRSRPDLVKGIPILLLILALAWEIPKNLFQEKPPLFIKNIPNHILICYYDIIKRLNE